MTKLEIKRYPKLIEEFAQENFNLKTLIGSLIALMLVNSMILAYLLHRGPMVIPLQADGSTATIDSRITESQVRSAVTAYLASRYTWTDDTIGSQLKKTEFFVSPNLVAAFRKAMVETLKYVHDKKVTQRVYARSIDVNFNTRVINVIADRITEFNGLKAATEMRLQLDFDLSDRTVVNPWGVYITKETEKAGQ